MDRCNDDIGFAVNVVFVVTAVQYIHIHIGVPEGLEDIKFPALVVGHLCPRAFVILDYISKFWILKQLNIQKMGRMLQ